MGIHADSVLLRLKREAQQERKEQEERELAERAATVDEGAESNLQVDDCEEVRLEIQNNSRSQKKVEAEHLLSDNSENNNESNKQKKEDSEKMSNKEIRSRYKIPPSTGLFYFVSAANYTGEIIEWIGFGIACGSLASFAFAVYTMSNLIPRALKHHEWYLQTFGAEYEKLGRKAVIPCLL